MYAIRSYYAILPGVIDPRQSEIVALKRMDPVWHLPLTDLLPLVETIDRDQAAPSLKGFTKHWLVTDGLASGIDGLQFTIFGPMGNEPEKGRTVEAVIQECGKVLGWSDVVGGFEVQLLIDLFDDIADIFDELCI